MLRGMVFIRPPTRSRDGSAQSTDCGTVHAIIARMSDPATPSRPPARPITQVNVPQPAEDKMVCERCGAADMYRMHAVWRCPACGFKTDCCGW